MAHKDHRIYSKQTKHAFMHIEVPVDGRPKYRMVKFWAGKREDGKTYQDSVHYVEYIDLRLMCFEIIAGLEPEQEIVSYKGKMDGATPISRIFKIKRGKADKNESLDESHKYFITVAHGPGRVDGEMIFPVKGAPREAWTFTSLKFTASELLALALDLQAWLNALISLEMQTVFQIGGEVYD